MNTFTLFHVALSLVGIFAGFATAFGMISSKLLPKWTTVFLWTTLATTVTGFMFPFHGFTPAIGFGVISLPVLGAAFYALYARKLAGGWRVVYIGTALFAFYLNFFVLIVQAFLKIPALNALAPTQKEPPFALAQGLGLVLFVVLAWRSLVKFRPVSVHVTPGSAEPAQS